MSNQAINLLKLTAKTVLPTAISFSLDYAGQSKWLGRTWNFLPPASTPYVLELSFVYALFSTILDKANKTQQPDANALSKKKVLFQKAFLLLSAAIVVRYISPYIKLGSLEMGNIDLSTAIKCSLLVGIIELTFIPSETKQPPNTSHAKKRKKKKGKHRHSRIPENLFIRIRKERTQNSPRTLVAVKAEIDQQSDLQTIAPSPRVFKPIDPPVSPTLQPSANTSIDPLGVEVQSPSPPLSDSPSTVEMRSPDSITATSTSSSDSSPVNPPLPETILNNALIIGLSCNPLVKLNRMELAGDSDDDEQETPHAVSTQEKVVTPKVRKNVQDVIANADVFGIQKFAEQFSERDLLKAPSNLKGRAATKYSTESLKRMHRQQESHDKIDSIEWESKQ